MNASINEHFLNTCIDSGIHLLKNSSHLLLPKIKNQKEKRNSPLLYKLLQNF